MRVRLIEEKSGKVRFNYVNRIFDVDNAVFRAIDYDWKDFILNLYWVICSLPIFYDWRIDERIALCEHEIA